MKRIKSTTFWIGFFIQAALILIAIFAPMIATHDPGSINVRESLLPPSWEHLFGTDGFGRDLFSRVVYGARVTIIISMSVALLSGLLGSTLGMIAGYFDKLERPIMAVMDGMMAIPSMLLAMAIVAALGNGMINLIIALVISDAPRVARVVRANVLSVKKMDYIEAARSMGASDLRIITRYVFPQCVSPLIVRLTMTMGFTMLEEAALTFLGLGLDPSTPSWGIILSESRRYIRLAPYYVFLPGIMLILAVYSVNALGDGLRDTLDPKLNKR